MPSSICQSRLEQSQKPVERLAPEAPLWWQRWALLRLLQAQNRYVNGIKNEIETE